MRERRDGTTARPRPAFDVADERLARAAWSRLAEPGDEVAGALVRALGASDALAWVYDAAGDPAEARRGLVAAAGRHPGTGDARAGGQAATDLAALMVPARGGPGVAGAGHDDETADRWDVGTDRRPAAPVARVLRAVSRWAPRLDGMDPRRELHVLARLGGALVVPGDPGWPTGVDDLGAAAPLCLWARGVPDLATLSRRSVAVVGARACTDYGRYVTGDVATGLADRGFTVVSGGAYGIDAAAHRGALAVGGPTVAFLAGGVDRFYPAGNVELLRAVVDSGGSVVSEVPPGSVPSRVRFLMRNRLIAAFATATVVVEAAWRSGSLSTAARAAELSRPVGVVPGPVTSVASSGCHRLLRDGAAVCVTDADEVAELAGALGQDAAPSGPRSDQARDAPHDGLDPVETRAWEALPLRSGRPVESVARAAGLAVPETIAALGRLELTGLADRVPGGWRRGDARARSRP
ncbi:DNA-processing protein DprA [Cellulosimicrobium sp. Marseille-Q4280]|uniref:DNA-processing protein DprA n=1 Tax=Cellulosimicrobium sp. Marseille-Q4280 TaxID=2937992 RepID=UPI002040B155|nr:DNA-processing protein DprA [Cellulosimicrobium sp. Marseille-Q4280]